MNRKRGRSYSLFLAAALGIARFFRLSARFGGASAPESRASVRERAKRNPPSGPPVVSQAGRATFAAAGLDAAHEVIFIDLDQPNVS